jgi:catechol 2,3-dioxygenase-like lactoylglutathione lyase family enzyme
MNLGAIGQIARPVRSVSEAREFYDAKLGLPHLFTFGKLAFFDCGGVRLFLEESEDTGAASLLYFRVADIQAATAELKQRGVQFVSEPHMIHRHENGVEEWMAFFQDPEGRPLGLMSQAKPAETGEIR